MLYIGIDWSQEHHNLCVLNEGGVTRAVKCPHGRPRPVSGPPPAGKVFLGRLSAPKDYRDFVMMLD